mmetsp:Transcript_107/g.400  ORF Transcript_107/g.400 Transcript_107/m.400 type:complete len:212 (-) Transcript_107:36-671(-)
MRAKGAPKNQPSSHSSGVRPIPFWPPHDAQIRMQSTVRSKTTRGPSGACKRSLCDLTSCNCLRTVRNQTQKTHSPTMKTLPKVHAIVTRGTKTRNTENKRATTIATCQGSSAGPITESELFKALREDSRAPYIKWGCKSSKSVELKLPPRNCLSGKIWHSCTAPLTTDEDCRRASVREESIELNIMCGCKRSKSCELTDLPTKPPRQPLSQ